VNSIYSDKIYSIFFLSITFALVINETPCFTKVPNITDCTKSWSEYLVAPQFIIKLAPAPPFFSFSCTKNSIDSSGVSRIVESIYSVRILP